MRLLAACLTPPKLCLVMELMDTSLEAQLYGKGPKQQQQRGEQEQDSGPMPLDKVRRKLATEAAACVAAVCCCAPAVSCVLCDGTTCVMAGRTEVLSVFPSCSLRSEYGLCL